MNLTFEASKGRKKHQGLVKGFFFFMITCGLILGVVASLL